MIFFRRKCRTCEAYQEHITYLRRTIDSLLKTVGASPVETDRILAENIQKEVEEHEAGSDDESKYGHD